MILLTPILAGNTTNIGLALLTLLLKSAVVIIITYVAARYLVPRLMHFIARTKSKELFMFTTLTLCFAVAFLTSEAGLSLALGAFLAGLIVSESEYSHQATSMILPFKELFTSFFFISIGMLLDVNFFIENSGIILLVVLGVFILKVAITALAVAFLKYPPRVVLLTGLALFQIGEFSFILSKVGIENDLLTPEMNQYFLSVSILTMILTPFIMIFSENISSVLVPSKLKKKWNKMSKEDEEKAKEGLDLVNHLIIVGYGINGRNVARAARHIEIPYVILELNVDIVKEEKAKGEPILFGDASEEHVLNAVKLNNARVVVVAISDPTATKYIVSNIRHISQSVHIIVRTRYINEIDDLLAIGADEVIPEEFETSIAIFTIVLQNFLVPVDEIENLINSIRTDNYKLFQSQIQLPKALNPPKLPNFNLSCIRLKADSGGIVGKSIKKADIRKKYNVNILALSRNNEMIYPISPDEKLLQDDLLYISGDPGSIDEFYKAVN